MTQPPAPALLLQDITCTFVSRDDPNARYTAVANTTLKVAPGEFVSVVGPTGCGKSTLLNVAAGLLSPSTGSVETFGEQLTDINKRAGYMFQGEALERLKMCSDCRVIDMFSDSNEARIGDLSRGEKPN